MMMGAQVLKQRICMNDDDYDLLFVLQPGAEVSEEKRTI